MQYENTTVQKVIQFIVTYIKRIHFFVKGNVILKNDFVSRRWSLITVTLCVNMRYLICTRQSYETMSKQICVYKLTYYAKWIQVLFINEISVVISQDYCQYGNTLFNQSIMIDENHMYFFLFIRNKIGKSVCFNEIYELIFIIHLQF